MIQQPRIEAKGKKTARGQVVNNIATQQYVDAGGGGGGGAWGAITGTLSDQTDLQAALDAKPDTSDITAAITAHEGASDPHPGYLTPAEAAGVYSPIGHSHVAASITDFTEASQDVVGAMVAAAGGSYNDAAGTITLPGGSVLKGTATVTVPANALEWTETVAATGVTGSNVAMICVAPHADSDENDAELLDIAAMSADPGTNTLTIDLAFLTPTQGAIKLNWSAF